MKDFLFSGEFYGRIWLIVIGWYWIYYFFFIIENWLCVSCGNYSDNLWLKRKKIIFNLNGNFKEKSFFKIELFKYLFYFFYFIWLCNGCVLGGILCR